MAACGTNFGHERGNTMADSAPVFAGDTIYAESEVLGKRDVSVTDDESHESNANYSHTVAQDHSLNHEINHR